MNLHQILILLLTITLIHSTFTNTTTFWSNQLGQPLNYECYSGTHMPMQVMSKSTGSTPAANQPCTTLSSPHKATRPPYLTHASH